MAAGFSITSKPEHGERTEAQAARTSREPGLSGSVEAPSFAPSDGVYEQDGVKFSPGDGPVTENGVCSLCDGPYASSVNAPFCSIECADQATAINGNALDREGVLRNMGMVATGPTVTPDPDRIKTPLTHNDAVDLAFVAWFDGDATALRLGAEKLIPLMSATSRATLYRYVRTLMAVSVAAREDAKEDAKTTCAWCGIASGCDCIERLGCRFAGDIGHSNCGPCIHDASKPKFACAHCFRGEGR